MTPAERVEPALAAGATLLLAVGVAYVVAASAPRPLLSFGPAAGPAWRSIERRVQRGQWNGRFWGREDVEDEASYALWCAQRVQRRRRFAVPHLLLAILLAGYVVVPGLLGWWHPFWVVLAAAVVTALALTAVRSIRASRRVQPLLAAFHRGAAGFP